jgi:hypothetical protein
MDILKLLPLPLELIDIIASYDRQLSVKKLKKMDCRYTLLNTIPKKSITHLANNKKGYQINFTNRNHKLVVIYTEIELLFVFVNLWDDEHYSYIYN